MGNPGYGAIGGEAPPPYIKDEPEENPRPNGQDVELPADGGAPAGNLVQLEADEPHYINLQQV